MKLPDAFEKVVSAVGLYLPPDWDRLLRGRRLPRPRHKSHRVPSTLIGDVVDGPRGLCQSASSNGARTRSAPSGAEPPRTPADGSILRVALGQLAACRANDSSELLM